jgi:RecB family exonuclease
MLVGKAVHSALETWMAVGGEDVGDLLDFFTASVESMKDEGPISTEEEEAARAMLFDYFAQLASVDKSLILGVEKQFEIVIGGARIVGIIDRIGYVDNNKDNIVLTDYKSGRSSVSQAKAKDNMQMAVYTIAAKALWPGAAHYTTELNYPRLHKSVIHEFTLEELLKHKREINELALAIKLDSRFAPKGSPPKCGYCGHNRYCGTGKFNARIWNAIQAKRTRNGN